MLQVEQFSAKLRAKATRVDATSEALDASRLLAQEGLNPRKWVMRCAALRFAGAVLLLCVRTPHAW